MTNEIHDSNLKVRDSKATIVVHSNGQEIKLSDTVDSDVERRKARVLLVTVKSSLMKYDEFCYNSNDFFRIFDSATNIQDKK